MYGTYFFGTSEEEIKPVTETGKIAVIPIDICGAVTLKNLYKSRAVLVFTERDRKEIYLNIINRSIPDKDKVSRMMSLDFEMRNIELCDFAVNYDNGIDKCVETVYNELHLEK